MELFCTEVHEQAHDVKHKVLRLQRCFQTSQKFLVRDVELEAEEKMCLMEFLVATDHHLKYILRKAMGDEAFMHLCNGHLPMEMAETIINALLSAYECGKARELGWVNPLTNWTVPRPEDARVSPPQEESDPPFPPKRKHSRRKQAPAAETVAVDTAKMLRKQ
jgi:hypothetical protein